MASNLVLYLALRLSGTPTAIVVAVFHETKIIALPMSKPTIITGHYARMLR